MRQCAGTNNRRCTEDVLGVSTDLRNGPQQQLVAPRLGIAGDDLDDFEAVEQTMGQAICFSPLNPLRLGVLSEAGVRY